MTVETNKALWEQWAEMWNGNLALAEEILAPDFVAHFAPAGNSPAEVRGPAGMKKWTGNAVAAFSSYTFETTVGPIADETQMAGRWIFKGIYQGGIPGASPAAVGKQIEYAGIDMLRMENGKIVEYWLCADIMQMLQQVGLIPS